MIDNVNDQKRKRNEIRIHLNFSSNKFYTDVLNKWCQQMTQDGIARILKPHYSKESVESITRQITVDESGCYEIKKIILDAFVLYFSQQNVVTNQNLNKQVACTSILMLTAKTGQLMLFVNQSQDYFVSSIS